jgi:peroxiredoxin Q/BCP
MQRLQLQLGALALACLAAVGGHDGPARAAASPAAPAKESKMSDTSAPAEQPESLNVKVGDPAPDFTLPMFPSGNFTLSELRGKRTVVLYFYPQDDTPGCTAQACSFRDLHEQFGKYDAVILGVSQDSLESHKAFTEKYSLPFSLLVDEGGKLRHLFGMPDPALELRARVTYVIDKQGVVRHIVNALPDKVDVEVHIQEALEWAKQLNAEDRTHAG